MQLEPFCLSFLGNESTVNRLMAMDNCLWSWGLRGRALALWTVERLQLKAKDLLKAKFST